MALWDLLTNAGSVLRTKGGNLFNNLKNNNGNMTGGAPQLPTIQLGVDGNSDPLKAAQVELQEQQNSTPLSFGDRMLGRTMTKDIQSVNPETGEASLQTISNYKPGLFNDLFAGANENFNNGFNVNNWRNNTGADGRQKGAAFRIGEGLGSLARGLATWGGDAFTAGAQGLDAGFKRQGVRVGDQLYRQQLKDNYGFTDDQLNNTRGYIDANTFNNLTKSQNSAMSLALRQQATTSMNKLRELQAEKLRIQNSTLPELEKARLIKANAEAAHAEEMQLARINYYNNAVANPLGWANYGLKAEESERKKKEAATKQKVIESLIPENPPTPKGGKTKSGNTWEEV